MQFTKNLSFLLAILASSSHVMSLPAAAVDVPVDTVDLGYATYQGVPFADTISGTNNTQFLGIRYAAPPTGSLRFAAPQEPATTTEIQVAANQPNRCYMGAMGLAPETPYRQVNSTASRRSLETIVQLESRDDLPPFNEDCLFLKYVEFRSVFSDQLTDIFRIQAFTFQETLVIRKTCLLSSGFMGEPQ